MTTKILILFAVVSLGSTSLLHFDSSFDQLWEHFKMVFDKSYNATEGAVRRVLFEQRVTEVMRHNLQADMGLHTYRKGINQFTDKTEEELSHQIMGCYRAQNSSSSSTHQFMSPLNTKIPEAVDWRHHGYVTPVKNQGHCGSCWAFSSTGSMEGQHFRKTGQLVSLSEQNLVDCSRGEGNEGCDGGWMDQAFAYVIKNKGIDTESVYPYTEKEGQCHFKRSAVGGTCSGFVDIPSGDEELLKVAVATVGPISAAINAGGPFATYRSGIYVPEVCPGSLYDLTHAVLVVGYGQEDGLDYWLVKNSWGEEWGHKGYVKMARNKKNLCGIATRASYPLV